MAQFFVDLEVVTEKRYDMAKFFQYTDNYDPLTSFFSKEISNLPQFGYFEVQGQDGRPENIAFKIYQDTQYWWILLLYNNKLEFDQFVTGELVRFPSADDIEDLFFSLKARENSTT